MRDISLLRWLEGRLWLAAFGAVFFILYGMAPWWSTPEITFHYMRLSWSGVPTMARIEGFKKFEHRRAVYSYATPDGVRHKGDTRQWSATEDGELLVYYLPGEPDVSVPRNGWYELEQYAALVLLGLACGTSLLRRIRRRRPA